MSTRRAKIHSILLALGLLASALLLAAPQPAPAQPPHASTARPSSAGTAAPANAAPSPDLAGIAHIALRVNDLNASVAFYRKLGFVRAFALSRDGHVYEAFIKLDDRQFLELYPATGSNPQTGFLHLCFEGADLQAAHAFYLAQGLAPTPLRTAGAGNLLFTMPGPLTPTGPQNMEYTQYMPGSLHSKDFGQHLGPDRIADKLLSVTLAVADPAAAADFYTRIGFLPADSSASLGRIFRLPGSCGQSIEIVGAEALGFKARFTLQLAPGMGEAALNARGIPFLALDSTFILHDPDGNDILLTPRT